MTKPIDRSEAVNLARNWLDGEAGGWGMTNEGIRVLADAVMRMDAHLLEPSPEALPLMPQEPTVEMIYAIAHAKWPEDKVVGVEAQRRIGIAVVPPRVEYEEAYGQYRRLFDLVKRHLPQEQR